MLIRLLALLQALDQGACRLLNGVGLRIENEDIVTGLWFLESGILACEIGDFPFLGLGIEAFGVALGTSFVTGLDVDLDKIGLTDHRASQLAQFPGGANEAGDGDDSGIQVEFGHFGDTADILSPVLIGKSEIVVQSGPDIVAIKNLGQETLLMQCPLKGVGNGALAGSGIPVKPENDRPLLQ